MGIDARMLLRKVTHEQATDDNIRLWSRRLCRAIGGSHFFLDRERGYHAITRSEQRWNEDDTSIVPGALYQQDGDDIVADPGECLLEVHVWTRYYGVGYERGDLLTLVAIARACEVIIPGCEVWYGGDSSGVCAAPWPEPKRMELLHHLLSESGRDYFAHFGDGSLFSHEARVATPECGLCKVPMVRNGYGPKYAAFFCNDCSWTQVTTDGGKTWHDKKEF